MGTIQQDASVSTKPDVTSRASRWTQPRYLLGAAALAMLVAGAVLDPHRDQRFVALAGFGIPSSCGFRILTGMPCPSCGLTRSVTLTLHGDLRTALSMHPLGPFVTLVAGIHAAFALASLTSPAVARRHVSPNAVGWAYGAFVLVLVAVGGARLLGYVAWPPG